MTKYIFLIVLFLAVPNFTQNLDSLQNRIQSLKALLNQNEYEYNLYENENSAYGITGIVQYRDGNEIMLYGGATILEGNLTNNPEDAPGYVNVGYIIISNYKIIYEGGSNVVSGAFYFLGKGTRQNSYGYDIPVKYFGDLPAEERVKQEGLKNQKQSLLNEIDKIDYQILSLKVANLNVQARDKLKSKSYNEAIKLLKEAQDLAPDNKEIVSQLYNAYNDLANDFSSKKDYLASLAIIKEAINTPSLSNIQEKDLKESYFIFTNRLAEEYYDKGQYSEAIKYFNDCTTYDNTKNEIIKERYAESYIFLGDEKLINGDIENAKQEYLKSIDIDGKVSGQIVQKLSVFKRPSMVYGTASIIPGLGQLLQGYPQEGIIHFVLFSSSVIAGTLLKNSSNNTYSDYVNAESEAEAVSLYKSAKDKMSYSTAAYGIGGAVLVYSLIDAFIKNTRYNNRFILTISDGLKVSDKGNGLSVLIKYYF
jgi:hypothetical protein